MRLQIAFQAGINDIGGENQGAFSQGRQFEWGVFGGGINDHDLVGGVEKISRDGFVDRHARQFFNGLFLVVNVLQVHRTQYVNSVFQQFLDILPAMFVAVPRIVVSETINNAQLRSATENCGYIDNCYALITHGGDGLEGDQDGGDFRRGLRL